MILPSYAEIPNSRSIAWVRNLNLRGFRGLPIDVWVVRPRSRQSLKERLRTENTSRFHLHELEYPDLFNYPGPFDFLFSTLILLLTLASRGAADLCISTDLRSGFCALILKKLRIARKWCHDDEDYAAAYYSKGVFVKLISKTLESAIIRNSDLVTSVSSTLEGLRKRQGARRTAIFPNGVYPGAITKNPYDKGNKKKLAYIGNLGEPWGVDLAIKAVSLLPRSEGYSLTIIGGGEEGTRLMQLAESLKIQEQISFLGPMDYFDARSKLATCGIGLAPYRSSSGALFGVPLKIKEYLSIGMLVVSTDVGEIRAFLKETEGGLCVREDAEQISRAIMTLCEAPDFYSKVTRAQKFVNQLYSWETIFRDQEQYILNALDMRTGQSQTHEGLVI